MCKLSVLCFFIEPCLSLTIQFHPQRNNEEERLSKRKLCWIDKSFRFWSDNWCLKKEIWFPSRFVAKHRNGLCSLHQIDAMQIEHLLFRSGWLKLTSPCTLFTQQQTNLVKTYFLVRSWSISTTDWEEETVCLLVRPQLHIPFRPSATPPAWVWQGASLCLHALSLQSQVKVQPSSTFPHQTLTRQT